MDKSESATQIVNFVLNIACWQTINKGFHHKLSTHIQDIIPDFIIEWFVVDNGELSFEGLELGPFNEWKPATIKLEDIKPEELAKILDVLKSINLFAS